METSTASPTMRPGPSCGRASRATPLLGSRTQRTAAVLIWLFALVLLAPAALVSAADAEDYAHLRGGVTELEDLNFRDVVGSNKFVLVQFYASHCDACDALHPVFTEAAREMHKAGSGVVFAKMNANFWGKTRDELGLMRYPTVLWFKFGKQEAYKGALDNSTGMVEWVSHKGRAWAAKANDVTEMIELEGKEMSVVVGYFKKQEGDAWAAFKALGEDIQDVRFVATSDSKVGKLAGLRKEGVSVVSNFPGEKRATVFYTGKASDEIALRAHITKEKLPLSIAFEGDNQERIYNKDMLVQIFLIGEPEHTIPGSGSMNIFRDVSKKFRGQVAFAHADVASESSTSLKKHFGTGGHELPLVVGLAQGGLAKFMHQGDFTKKAISKFVKSIVDGKANHYYKSGPEPTKASEFGILNVVSSTLNAQMISAEKDALLVVTTDWCDHCKALEPVLKKLARRFKDIDSVVIGMMDGELNEHPILGVKGFPSLFFFPASSEKLVYAYDNGEKPRSLQALTDFILKQARTPIDQALLYYPPVITDEEKAAKKAKRERNLAEKEAAAIARGDKIKSTGNIDGDQKEFVEQMIKMRMNNQEL